MLHEQVRNSCTFMHMYVYRTRFLYDHDIELYKFRHIYTYLHIFTHIYIYKYLHI